MPKSNPHTTTSPWTYVGLIFFAIILATMLFNSLVMWIVSLGSIGPYVPRIIIQFVETVQLLNLIITTINAVLLVYLLHTYVSVYLHIRSQFSLGLIALASALLAHTLTTNPLVGFLFDFHSTGGGPFVVIPSIFTLIASLVLVHLSQQ